ncbi:MAG: HipA family kinase, partial [Hoeflea sp.]|nr:HipA family kinase [Hoeflea sp.]
PLGEAALVSELVCGELAKWFGLTVPPFAIIRVCDVEITMLRNGRLIQPPLFFSKTVDGIPRDGTDTFLTRLRSPGDVAKLVIFDTWVRNWDRYLDGEANNDNLLYVRSGKHKYDIVPIDHSNCLIGADPEFPDAVCEDWIRDSTVYGKFPEFDEYLTAASVRVAMQKLQTLRRNFVDEVVNSVPLEWGLGSAARTALVELICLRSLYVVNTLSARLVDEPGLPGIN